MDKLNNFTLGQIASNCYMVQRGKPASVSAIKKSVAEKLKEYVEDNYGLNVFIDILNDEWVEFWIYKHEYLIDIIKQLPDIPKNNYDHWVLGKIFGYSDESIKEFITSIK
jgi:hypothetical protein